jgi:hypothetical protein
MAERPDCPGDDYWQSLLDGPVRADQQERCEQHLSSCPTCQARMDEAVRREAALLQLGRQFGDPTETPADPTLVQVLEQLSHISGLGGGARQGVEELYFLRPADRPGLLGLLGPYEVHEVIGQGGMGIVLKAHDAALHRHVAIKVLSLALAGSTTARRRFRREAQAAAAVCHEHVVPVYGVYEADGLPYLVMQYVSGESLQDRLDRVGSLEPAEVVEIGYQTAAGLAAAHAHGLIHRDIKPANLLLEEGLARVRITDFGLARMVDDTRLTYSGVIAGTPEYMAPEQARGEPVDHRADLFSLGSVLYAMCVGVPPFRGTTAVALLRQVSDHEPAPVHHLNPNVPPELAELIRCLLAKDPAERVQSAQEVAEWLRRYLMHLRRPDLPPPSLSAPPSARAAPAERPKEAGSWLWGQGLCAAVCLVLALLGLRYLLVFGPTQDGTAPLEISTPACLDGHKTARAPRDKVLRVTKRDSPHPSFLDVTLGHQGVAGVGDAGFFCNEESVSGPFRWTNGAGRLVIPLASGDQPRALLVQLQRPKDTWLRITANDRELLTEPTTDRWIDRWEQLCDLSSLPLSERLVVEIQSNTITPAGDSRAIGVKVRGIRLLKTEDMPLGVREVAGVAEAGFHGPEMVAGRLCRWTNGAASLTVPLGGPVPRALALSAWIPERPEYWVRVTVNGKTLFDGPVRQGSFWSRELSLEGVELKENARIELESSTFFPPSPTDRRTLGIRLTRLSLLTDRDLPKK